MAQSELAQVIEEYHRTIDAIVTGDPEPQKRLWSRGDDVTLANPSAPGQFRCGRPQSSDVNTVSGRSSIVTPIQQRLPDRSIPSPSSSKSAATADSVVMDLDAHTVAHKNSTQVVGCEEKFWAPASTLADRSVAGGDWSNPLRLCSRLLVQEAGAEHLPLGVSLAESPDRFICRCCQAARAARSRAAGTGVAGAAGVRSDQRNSSPLDS
jgi:hypothetical protein